MSKPKSDAATPAPKRKRADAERNITSILDAAVEVLASDPDASISDIARRAGVVRATLYMHFPSRDVLLDAVMEYTLADVTAAIDATDPSTGEPHDALERLLRATWRKLDRLHALISLNSARLSPEEIHRRHMPFIAAIAPVIERGQKQDDFRRDVPTAWHLSMLLAMVHAASGEVQSGRIEEAKAEAAMLTTALNALSG